MTDATRGTLGINLASDAPRTLLHATPDLVPLVQLDFGTRGQISVHFGPNPGNESRNGLPAGCTGAVVQARVVSTANGQAPDILGTT